ncbi:hypothetical protein BH10BAC2_BH10BAC2_07430 [soil metagenome]
MKALYSFIILLFVAISLHAQPPAVPAETGTVFGAKTTADDAISVEQLAAIMKSREGKKTEVKLKGTVITVCEAMGCWLKIKSANGDLMVRMKDHAFFVPLALNGKVIVIDGIAEEKQTSVAQLKHNAEDTNKSKEEIDAIKEPKSELTITAKGVLVL